MFVAARDVAHLSAAIAVLLVIPRRNFSVPQLSLALLAVTLGVVSAPAVGWLRNGWTWFQASFWAPVPFGTIGFCCWVFRRRYARAKA